MASVDRDLLEDVVTVQLSPVRLTALNENANLPRRLRYQRMAALVREWMKDTSGHDEATWPVIEAELREHH